MGGRKLRVIPDKGEGGAVVHGRIDDEGDGGTLVHGRIDDENRFGYAGVEVRIENERGETIRKTETDESGYYSFALDEEETELLSKELPEGVFIGVYDKEGARISRTSGTIPVGDYPKVNFPVKKARKTDKHKKMRLTPREKGIR
jgi:hypothetical protein